MRMNLLYVHSPELGYGRLGVKLAEAVVRQGVDIYDDLPAPTNAPYEFIPHGDKAGVCGHVSWIATPGHCRGWWQGQTRSLFSMWESNHLPEPFRESLDVFDTIIVPSMQNEELFSRYHNNVKYVPLGIDPTEWFAMPRPGLDTEYFTFLISGGGYRKGSDLVIEAFKKVFDDRAPSGPPPRLFIHSAKASEFPIDDRIHLITGKLNAEEERALYAMAHCYVQPSRGEGFGLRPLQALAQGCPTIATNAHGHGAYGHLLTYPLGWSFKETPTQAFHHGPAGTWWEPDFDELCQAMEDVYANYEEAVAHAAIAAKEVAAELTWDRCADRYLEAIGEYLDAPDIVPEKWVEPDIRRYLVRVQTPRFFEVGGLQYLLEPGREYWEPADVKRVLYDSGHLDPSCLAVTGEGELSILESGLTREQYEQIPAYSGAHSLCPTCSQRLNTNVPNLEELEAMPMPPER